VTARIARTRPLLVVAVLATAATLVVIGISATVGPLAGVGAIAALVAVLALLADQRLALLVAIVAVVGAESSETFGIPAMAQLYAGTPLKLSAVEILALLAAGAVVLHAVRAGGRVRWPRVFLPPLLCAAVAIVFGILNARFGGDAPGYAVRSVLEGLLPLFLVPVVVVNVVRTREDLRRAIGIGAALAVLKAVTGLAVLAAGVSATLYLGGPHLTYLEATPNLVMLVFLIGVAAARLAGIPLPRWVVWAAPLVAAAFVLSYRRLFWVGAIVALGVVVILASGRVGRRLVLPALAVVGACAWLVSTAGVTGELSGSVIERGASISPSKVRRNDQDRYRLAERRNVVSSLRDEPLAGLGVGVPWEARYPMPFEYEGGRDYVHMGILWWWLKMGILGAISYLWLMTTVVVAGVATWRQHPDRFVRVAALGAGLGTLALAIVEVSASFVGPDQRTGVVLGAIMGLLAVAREQVAAARKAPPAGRLA
jgi:O-Antigen ligase